MGDTPSGPLLCHHTWLSISLPDSQAVARRNCGTDRKEFEGIRCSAPAWSSGSHHRLLPWRLPSVQPGGPCGRNVRSPSTGLGHAKQMVMAVTAKVPSCVDLLCPQVLLANPKWCRLSVDLGSGGRASCPLDCPAGSVAPASPVHNFSSLPRAALCLLWSIK